MQARGRSEDTAEAQARQVRGTQERLKLTEVRTAELSKAPALLSTEDHLSEVDVLSIVRDLNENIFQVAITLTGAWGKLESSQATGRLVTSPSTPDN